MSPWRRSRDHWIRQHTALAPVAFGVLVAAIILLAYWAISLIWQLDDWPLLIGMALAFGVVGAISVRRR